MSQELDIVHQEFHVPKMEVLNIRNVSGLSDKDAASFQDVHERLMAIYGNLRNGVAETMAIKPNAALAMWPDPANVAANTSVATAVENRRNGTIVIELYADYFPFGGPIPALVLNLLFAAVHSNCGMGVGAQDIAVVHANNFLVYIYGHDTRRPAATPGQWLCASLSGHAFSAILGVVFPLRKP